MALYYLLALAILICIVGFAVSVAVARKQKDQEYDKGMNAVSRKHNIAANPALLAYIVFPVIVVLGAAILIYYYGG